MMPARLPDSLAAVCASAELRDGSRSTMSAVRREACWACLAGRGRCRLQLASAASASARRPGGLLHPPPSSAEADQMLATQRLRRQVDST